MFSLLSPHFDLRQPQLEPCSSVVWVTGPRNGALIQQTVPENSFFPPGPAVRAKVYKVGGRESSCNSEGKSGLLTIGLRKGTLGARACPGSHREDRLERGWASPNSIYNWAQVRSLPLNSAHAGQVQGNTAKAVRTELLVKRAACIPGQALSGLCVRQAPGHTARILKT